MKMKKIYFAVMFTAVLMMTGCTKIKTNKLQGFWSVKAEYNSYWGGYVRSDKVYEFVNSNTVFQYVNVSDGCYSDEPGYDDTPMPKHSGWYYGWTKTWTYVFENDKVILSDGTIFTYMDDKLYKDGSSDVLYPW